MALSTMYAAKANSPQTTLAADITAADTSMTLVDATVLPAAPNLCTLGDDENAEVVSYTTITGNVVSGLVRGQSGTVASVWTTGTPVARDFTSYDHDTFKGNIEDLNTNKSDINHTHDDRYYTEAEIDTALASKTNLSVVAGTFSTSTAYAIDDLVIYQGVLYRFIAAHSAGAWNSAHVTACTIAEVMRHFGTFQITGTVSSGSMTLTDARIDSNHWRIPKNGIQFGTPSNVTSGVDWSTNISNHTVTLSATYTAATTVDIDMVWYQDAQN